MPQIVIAADRRDPAGKNVNRRLRHSGKMPAVLYGQGREALPLTVDPDAVKDILYSESGRNTIFNLRVDGGDDANAMVKDYQLDPVRGSLIHADFIVIAMDQLLELTVHIEIVGEAIGVKVDGGMMDIVSREIEVECLPGDIPESIKVDVSELKINDYVRVKNLPAIPRVKYLTDPEVVLAAIVPPVKEEEVVEEVSGEGGAEPEVIKKGKGEDGEEPAQKGKSPKPEST
jgi:large subunit ribosomal protein L25